MKKSKKQMDISSSEDEISSDILKEAIDQQFLHDNLYATKKAEISSQCDAEAYGINKLNTVSLRTKKKEDQFTNFGVTSSFQNFVAKKLEELLDKIVKLEKGQATDCYVKRQKRNKNLGIKLLSNSKNFLITTEICTTNEGKCKKYKRYCEIIEDNEAMSKFREVAVNSEHVLSKVDTKAWTSKRPEPEFKYKKLKDGILVEQHFRSAHNTF